MKTRYLMSTAATLLWCGAVALAQAPSDEHAGHHAANAAAPAAAPGKDAALPDRMQDNLKRMHELMRRIHASKDPAERQQLLRRHAEAMQEQMHLMHGMGGGPGEAMHGNMKMGGDLLGAAHAPAGAPAEPMKGDGMMDGEMMRGHRAMQERMDRMEEMMGQMLDHQAAQQDLPPTR